MASSTFVLPGWRDGRRAVARLTRFLEEEGVGPVRVVELQSEPDSMTFEELADGFQDRLEEAGVVDSRGDSLQGIDVVACSTSALVVRQWLWRFYLRGGRSLDRCPLERLVLLAPANFGSPFAHRGKAFLGNLARERWRMRESLAVGRGLLDGLEMGSPLQWRLAHRDLLGPEPCYADDRIRTTILIGIDSAPGLRDLVDEPGTDGAVLIAGAGLDSWQLRVDCCRPRNGSEDPAWEWRAPPDGHAVGFGVLPGLDHAGLLSSLGERSDRTAQAEQFLLRALRTEAPDDHRRLRADLSRRTEATYRTYLLQTEGRRFQQFLVRAVDDHGVGVRDWTLEMVLSRDFKRGDDGRLRPVRRAEIEDEMTRQLQRPLTRGFHTCTADPSYRRFLVDVDEVERLLQLARKRLGRPLALGLRIHVPERDRGVRYAAERVAEVVVHTTRKEPPTGRPFFCPNTTTLLELRVDRATDAVRLV